MPDTRPDMTGLTPAMVRMLLRLSRSPNNASAVGGRGESNTASALKRRGLVHMWPRNGEHYAALTDAGCVAVALHNTPSKE